MVFEIQRVRKYEKIESEGDAKHEYVFGSILDHFLTRFSHISELSESQKPCFYLSKTIILEDSHFLSQIAVYL
jgi:hypothetical protein